MSAKLNILVLAAGAAYYQDSDGGYPIYLAEFNGSPVIEQTLRACTATQPERILVACREEDISHFHLESIPSLLNERASMLSIRGTTQGAACTALLAAPFIDNQDNLLIISINEILDLDYMAVIEQFRATQVDAGLLTFESIHPRYSYVRVDPQTNLVVESAEKRPISHEAAASFYWFAQGADFVSAAKEMIRKDAHTGGLFYICPALNQMILKQKKIGRIKIAKNQYHPLKTDRQIQSFEAGLDRKA